MTKYTIDLESITPTAPYVMFRVDGVWLYLVRCLVILS